MAMTVANNTLSLCTLNTLISNSSSLAKSLEKVSSGQKLNSAQDGASAYSISEKMRTLIRGLSQCNRNSQSARMMIGTAEEALQNSLAMLRTMKERTIQAANGIWSDADYTIMNKEYQQYLDQIESIAVETTYNGMRLLDGTWAGSHETVYNWGGQLAAVAAAA